MALSNRISPLIRNRWFSAVASSIPDEKLIPSCGPISKFDQSDPLKIDLMLTEDERGMRDAARAFCQEELMPNIVEANRHENFDRGIMKVSDEGVTRELSDEGGTRGTNLCREKRSLKPG